MASEGDRFVGKRYDELPGYVGPNSDEGRFDVVRQELSVARKWPLYNSAHEGYAVILEELDELWDHVKTNQKVRDLSAMRREAAQIAACAIRFMEMIDNERGRK